VGGRSVTEHLSGETGTAEVVVDARGCVTHWNGPADRLLGYPADEIAGLPALGLLVERPAR
jgi:PAS domain-containing protein